MALWPASVRPIGYLYMHLALGDTQAPRRGGESAQSRWLPAVNFKHSPSRPDQHFRGDRPTHRHENVKVLREPVFYSGSLRSSAEFQIPLMPWKESFQTSVFLYEECRTTKIVNGAALEAYYSIE